MAVSKLDTQITSPSLAKYILGWSGSSGLSTRPLPANTQSTSSALPVWKFLTHD